MVKITLDIPRLGHVEIEADLASLLVATVQFLVLAGSFLNKNGMLF